MRKDFIEYTQILTPDNKDVRFPPNILHDLDLMYSLSSSQFEIQGISVIENMIYNVCYTPIGSRIYEPEFGSNILVIIHEQLIQETATYLEIELFSAIRRWVPYASMIFKQTRVIPVPDEQLFRAYINYVDLFTGLHRGFILDLIR